MSVDEIGSVSPDMFNEFFADEIREMSLRYGGIGIHCCADSRHQWENLRNVPGLVMLNLYRPEEVLWESFDYFRDKTAMWPGKLVDNLPRPMKRKKKDEYPKGARLVLTEHAQTREDAVKLAETMKEEYE